MGSLGWPAWILLSVVALSGLLAIALHLLRFRYSLAFAFPAPVETHMEIAFLGWRKVLVSHEDDDGEWDEKHGDKHARSGTGAGDSAQASPASGGTGGHGAWSRGAGFHGAGVPVPARKASWPCPWGTG